MDNKYQKFYVDWWNVRKRTIYLVVGLLIVGGSATAMIRYASRNNWFIEDKSAAIPKDAARIVSFEGDVRVTRAATRETIVVTRETYLLPGDTVQTLDDGRATIQNIDGSRTQVKPNSAIVIRDTSTLLGGKNVRIAVEDGQVNIRTNDQQDVNNVVEIAESENKLLSNTDASFNAAAGTQAGEIRVSRGGVESTIGGEKTLLGENEFAAIDSGRMTARERLLAPPQPTGPANSSQIVDSGSGVNVTFTWQDSEGNPAQNYHLQISRSPVFASDATLVDRGQLTSREFRLTLSPGTYYWRLKSTSRSGQVTAWNDAWKCVVVRGNAAVQIDATELGVERVGGNVYIITGRTSPGMIVRAGGRETFSNRDGAFRLQISTGATETAVEVGDERGNRAGFVISLRSGELLRRY